MFVEFYSSHGSDSFGDGFHNVEDLSGDPGWSNLAGSVRDHRDLVGFGHGGSDLSGNLGHHLQLYTGGINVMVDPVALKRLVKLVLSRIGEGSDSLKTALETKGKTA